MEKSVSFNKKYIDQGRCDVVARSLNIVIEDIAALGLSFYDVENVTVKIKDDDIVISFDFGSKFSNATGAVSVNQAKQELLNFKSRLFTDVKNFEEFTGTTVDNIGIVRTDGALGSELVYIDVDVRLEDN